MKTIEYRDGVLWLLDQTRLPRETVFLECRTHTQVADAIYRLSVRGAPAIGVAAAHGVVLAARELRDRGSSSVDPSGPLHGAIDELRRTRPTAVNLAWALRRMEDVVRRGAGSDLPALIHGLEREAGRIFREEETASASMARFGAELIPEGASVLTHCNTGALAAGGRGTALAAIREAHDQGKRIHV